MQITEQLAIFLAYQRGVSVLFQTSSVQSLAEVMLPRYIKIPTGEDLDKVMETFEQNWSFPQCALAVDGSHKPIKASASFHADYYNL